MTRPPAPHPDAADVIVVGARAAGAATAMLLARAGLRTIVLERGRPGADTLSTHALMKAAVVQLHRWGVLDRIVAAGTPAVRRATFDLPDRRLVVDVSSTHGVDALYAPRRTVLDPLLVDAAREAGADVRYGIAVDDVVQDQGRVRGVVTRDAVGRRQVLRAPLVIGADGMRSIVAERVGARIERQGRAAGASTYGYWSGVEVDGYEWIFRPRAFAGLIPTNDGEVCVFVGATPERIGRGGHALLRELLREVNPEVAARVESGRAPAGTRTFGGRPGFLRRAWGQGWALVGDAGYWKDPISAHGLTDALRDAELLARAVVASEGGGQAHRAAELAGYQALRDRLSLPMFAVVEQIAALQWEADEIGGLLLEVNAAMADEVELVAGLSAGALA
jgi:flavin-dependent dehydrogenase